MAKANRDRRTARRRAASEQAAREQRAASKQAASERSPDKRSPGTRYRALATGRASAVFSLLALFAANFLWFSSFSFRTITADDLGAWSFFTGHPSLGELFLNGSGGKYRPVTNLVQYVLLQAFPNDYRSWVAFSTVLNFVVVAALFLLIRKLTKGDSIIALLGGLLYVTSRFSYYNILQLNGVMEALSLLFLVLIMYVTVSFYEDSRRWPGFALAGLYLLITLTHERYLALLPFLPLVPLFHGSLRRRSKVGLMALMCAPFVLNVVLKQFVLNSTLLMGTGGQPIALSPPQVAGFVAAGLANMAWINWGPDYLSGISFLRMDAEWQALVMIIFVALLVIVIWMAVRMIRTRDSAARRRELKGFALWLVLFLSLLLAASITFRQEYRWLYAPFVVLVAYFCYQYARLPMRAALRYGVLAIICILAVTADSYYKANERGVFFMGWQAAGDAAYDLTIGKYGQGMRERTLYVENASGLSGTFRGDLFLSPYLGKDYRKIVWVDSFAQIDPTTIDRDRSLFMWVDSSQSPARLVTSESDPTVFGVLRLEGWSSDDWIGHEGSAALTSPIAADVGLTLFVPEFIPANQVVVRLDGSVVFDASLAGGTTRSFTAHLHRGLNVVRVTCQQAISPATLGVGTDIRPLGCRLTVQKP